MSPISRESDIPLYKQICEDIIQKVNSGVLQPGDKVQPEIEMSQYYNVSRMTVRQALNELLRERVLTRKRGYGTFVAEKTVKRVFHPTVITGFYDEFSSSDSTLKSEVVEKCLVFPSSTIARLMKIDERELVCKLTRVRYLDGQPLIVDESFINKKFWESIEKQDFSDCSLFAFLEDLAGEKPVTANIEIHAVGAPQTIANYLKISKGAPIINAVMANYYKDSHVFHVGRLYCPEYLGLNFTIGANNLEND